MSENTLDAANIKMAEANVLASQAGSIRQLIDSGAFTSESVISAVTGGDLTNLTPAS